MQAAFLAVAGMLLLFTGSLFLPLERIVAASLWILGLTCFAWALVEVAGMVLPRRDRFD